MWQQILHDTASLEGHCFCLPARRYCNLLELWLLDAEEQVGHKSLIFAQPLIFCCLPDARCKQIFCLSNSFGTRLSLSDLPGSKAGKN